MPSLIHLIVSLPDTSLQGNQWQTGIKVEKTIRALVQLGFKNRVLIILCIDSAYNHVIADGKRTRFWYWGIAVENLCNP